MLNVQGGHPGDAAHAVIRRFTSPVSGTLQISGELAHAAANGDGVRGRIVSSSRGRIGEWTAAHGNVATSIESTPLAAGETIDFVVDCLQTPDYDAFTWKTTLRMDRTDGASESWNSHDGIEGPKPPAPPRLDRWGQLGQVLLMSNEFMFVD
jgi:hypothetical protein